MNVDPSGLNSENYKKYKNTFTTDDFELSMEAQERLADYKNDYENGDHRRAHKKANLLRSLDHAFQEHFGFKYTFATKAQQRWIK